MTHATAIGRRRALVYGPMAVLLGGAVCLILEPSLGSQVALTAFAAAAGVGVVHALVRMLLQRRPGSDAVFSGPVGLVLSLCLPAFLVLLACFAYVDHLPPMGLAMAGFVSLAMGAYWLSSASRWAWAPRFSALMIYLGGLLLPVATLFALAPAASVWAALAAVPAWHARRIMLRDPDSREVAGSLLSAAVFIFALVLVTGAAVTALLSLRTGGSL